MIGIIFAIIFLTLIYLCGCFFLWCDKPWIMAKSRTKRIKRVHGIMYKPWVYELQTGWWFFWDRVNDEPKADNKTDKRYRNWVKKYNMQELK